MSPRSDRQKQRYAEDPEYRARILASNLRYATAHKEEIAAKAREKWATDPEFRAKCLAASRARDQRADNLKQLYGLSTNDYDAMLRAQNDACAICKRKSAERLCVDHCHERERVRGLLCRKCNTGLGCFRDDPARIRAAIAYRKANGAVVRQVLGRALSRNPHQRSRAALSHCPLSQTRRTRDSIAKRCRPRRARSRPRFRSFRTRLLRRRMMGACCPTVPTLRTREAGQRRQSRAVRLAAGHWTDLNRSESTHGFRTIQDRPKDIAAPRTHLRLA